MKTTVDTYWSELYDDGVDFFPLTSAEILKFMSFAHQSTPKTALDIGCGTGQLTRELYHLGYEVTGVDASESAVRIAESMTPASYDRLHYFHLDVDDDNLAQVASAPVGLVICKLVYTFIANKPDFLEKIKQLLDPDGLLVIVTVLPNDAAPEKKHVATAPEDMEKLDEAFNRLALYTERRLTYFVGRPK